MPKSESVCRSPVRAARRVNLICDRRQQLAGLAQADPRKKAPACQGLNEPPAGGMGAGGMRVVAGMKLCLAVMVPPRGCRQPARQLDQQQSSAGEPAHQGRAAIGYSSAAEP
jgi:hypothetical protein